MTLPKIHSVPTIDIAERGDVRGPYGYGRAAHGSDPRATYRFEAHVGSKPQHLLWFPDLLAKAPAHQTGRSHQRWLQSGKQIGAGTI